MSTSEYAHIPQGLSDNRAHAYERPYFVTLLSLMGWTDCGFIISVPEDFRTGEAPWWNF